jgi:hypothetical protein
MRHGEPNHTCRICGKKYFACDTCDSKIGKSWRAVTCTAEHYDIYYALWRYNYGEISDDEIKAILSKAEANKWKDSPSYAKIIELIGEPEEEAEEDKVPDDEKQSDGLMLNLALVKDEEKPVVADHAPEEPKKAEAHPQKYGSSNYNHNGKNSRHKVGGKYAYRNNMKETSRR